MICGSLVARIEYNYVCIRNAEDTTVLWRTRIVRVLGPSGNGGGGGGGGVNSYTTEFLGRAAAPNNRVCSLDRTRRPQQGTSRMRRTLAQLPRGTRLLSTQAAQPSSRLAALRQPQLEVDSESSWTDSVAVVKPKSRSVRKHERHPEWLKVQRPGGDDYMRIHKNLRASKLATVLPRYPAPVVLFKC